MGYAFLPGFLSLERMAELTKWIREILSWSEKSGKHMIYFEDEEVSPGKKLANRIENFVPYHKGFNNFCSTSELMECIAILLGEEAVLFKDKINLKPPGGRPFTPHQDSSAGWSEYTDFFITAMVPIDENTVENGCLEISPKNYQRSLISKKWKPIEGEELELIQWQSMPMKPGDVLFFDSYMPHQSHKNYSEHPRRNLYLTFNRKDDGDFREKYYADKRRNYPPDCERQVGKTYFFRV